MTRSQTLVMTSIVVVIVDKHPTFMCLTVDIGYADLALRLRRLQRLFEAFLGPNGWPSTCTR
jgi:hypothetical protein